MSEHENTSTIHDATLTCDGSGSSEHEGSDPTYIGSFALVCFGVGVVTQLLLMKFPKAKENLQFTFCLFIFGLIFGVMYSKADLGTLDYSISIWLGLSPHLLIYILLPPLLFTSGYNVNYHVFMRLANQAIFLAVFGVLISMVLTAVVCVYIFTEYQWTWVEAMTLGALLAATDPVAVVALLHELGAPDTYGVLIEGESLLNDGTASVLFFALEQVLSGQVLVADPLAIFLRILYCATVGPLIGFALSIFLLYIMQSIWSNAVLEVMTTVVAAYGSFFLGELTKSSGILAVIAAGLYLGGNSKPYVEPEAAAFVRQFWTVLEWGANSVVFIFSGVVCINSLIGTNSTTKFSSYDFGMLIILYIALNVIRGLGILMQWPFIARMGYGMDWKKATIAAWSGLRGALALVSALYVFHECKCSDVNPEPCLKVRTAELFMFLTSGVVLLTLIINGPTTKPLMNWLKVNKKTAASRSMFDAAVRKYHNGNLDDYRSLQEDDEFKGADWNLVFSFLPELSTRMLDETALIRAENPYITKKSLTKKRISLARNESNRFDDEDLDPLEAGLAEGRRRFLVLVKTKYLDQFATGSCTSWPALRVLSEAADRAIDHDTTPINEWKYSLKQHCELPRLYLLLLNYPSVRKAIGNYFIQRQLALGYDIAIGFLNAHNKALEDFKRLSLDEGVKLELIREVEAMISDAHISMDDMEKCFIEVSKSRRTNLAIQLLLNQMTSRATEMLDHAEIDMADMELFEHNLDQKTRLLSKQLGLMNMEDEFKILSESFLFKKLDKNNRPILLNNARLFTMKRGEMINYNSEEVFIIVRGIVLINHVHDSEVRDSSLGGSGGFTITSKLSINATSSPSLCQGHFIGGGSQNLIYSSLQFYCASTIVACAIPTAAFSSNRDEFMDFLMQHNALVMMIAKNPTIGTKTVDQKTELMSQMQILKLGNSPNGTVRVERGLVVFVSGKGKVIGGNQNNKVYSPPSSFEVKSESCQIQSMEPDTVVILLRDRSIDDDDLPIRSIKSNLARYSRINRPRQGSVFKSIVN